MPLLRRIPKRGFNNVAFGTRFETVNIEDLNAFDNGATITPETLLEHRVIKRRLVDGVKILGNGELKKKLTVKAQRFSAAAREKITQAGGTCEDLPLRTIHHKPVEAAAPAAGK